MDNQYILVEKWMDHCHEVGHTPVSKAMDKGEHPDPKKHATFAFSYGTDRINCCARGCDWTFKFGE